MCILHPVAQYRPHILDPKTSDSLVWFVTGARRRWQVVDLVDMME
jgi:hypothetical protein